MFGASKTNSASTGGVADPYFYDVTMLLTGNGTNGAQNNTFIDSSSNNFTITRNGNTTQGSFSPYGSLWSNYFDGSSTESIATNTALNFGTGDFTVECWFNRTVTNDSGTVQVMFADGSDAAGLVAALYNNKLYCYFVGTGGIFNSVSPTISNNTWYHFAWTRSGSTMTAYLNGTALGTVSNSGNHSSSTGGTVIGRSAGGTTMNYWQGYISNVRFVKGSAVYSSSFTPSTTPLTAVSGTSLLTCQSNRFIDNSSNAFALTVNGTPSVQRFSPFNPTASYDTATIGGSGYFDGSGDKLGQIQSTAFNFSTACTYECWVYATAIPSSGEYTLWEQGDTNHEDMRLVIKTDGKLGLYINGDMTGSTSGEPTLPLNQWVHVVVLMTNASGTARAYIYQNGVKIRNNTPWNGFSYGNDYGLAIGSWYNNTNNFYGYISNFRVSNIARYDYSSSTLTVPTTPFTNDANTTLLCSMTNAGIPDSAMMNDLETVGSTQIDTSVKKFGTGSIIISSATNDYLAVNGGNLLYLPYTSPWTIEFWMYSTTSYTPAVWYGGSTDQLGFCNSARQRGIIGQNSFNGAGDASLIVSGTAISANTWGHIAIVCNGSGVITLYLNGTSVGSASTTKDCNIQRIGQFPSGSSFNGYIDDLRITKGYARYTSNFTPPTTALPTY